MSLHINREPCQHYIITTTSNYIKAKIITPKTKTKSSYQKQSYPVFFLSTSLPSNIMKSFSKNKLSLCFRPVVDMDSMIESKVSAHCSEIKPVLRFSKRWIKAMLLETILNRRANHKNRYGLDCFGTSKYKYSTHKKETKSSLSTLSTPSSSFSSPKVSLSQSKNISTKVEGKESSQGSTLLEKQKMFEFYAMCLVLISLIFTVFWGKLYGIILTTIFLYFFSLWNSNYSCQKNCTYTKDGCKETLWKVCSK